MPSQAKEAMAFALMGFLTVHGLAGTVPGATGARAPSVLGSITPGSGESCRNTASSRFRAQ